MLVNIASGAASSFYGFRMQKAFLYSFITINGFFVVFPQIDLAVSRYFYQSGVFFISHNPYWIAVRDFHRLSQWYLLVFVMLTIALYALWPQRLSAVAPHKIVYITLIYLFGPGVLVHSLKLIIGRARPRNLAEFGGSVDFTPAWQLADMCRHSCSFPSGESSAAVAMLPLLIFVPAHLRIKAALVFIPILALVSLNRVFMGAHFLSDVVIAWTLIIGLMIWLWPRISRHADVIDSWVRLRGESLRTWLYVR